MWLSLKNTFGFEFWLVIVIRIYCDYKWTLAKEQRLTSVTCAFLPGGSLTFFGRAVHIHLNILGECVLP